MTWTGDGVDDLAVGALGYDGYRGAVHMLFMNSNGTVKKFPEDHWRGRRRTDPEL